MRAGRDTLELKLEPPVSRTPLTAGLFFVAAIAMAGLPPLSGFIGKLLILDAAYSTPYMVWTWVIVLSTSLVAIVGFSRAGSLIFWKSQSVEREGDEPERDLPVAMSYVAIGGVLTLLVAHTVFAGPVYHYMASTSGQLFAPEPYIETVLETPGKMSPREGED